MKLSFSTLGCHEYTLDQIIACGKKYGFNGVELRHVEKNVLLWELPDFSSAASLAASKRKINDAGLEVCVVGASGSFSLPGLFKRREQMDLLRRWSEVAQGLGCPYVRVFGGPVPDGQSMEETLKWSSDGLNEAIPVMAKYGVTLLLETHDSFSSSKGLLPLIQRLNGSFGIVWDILHPIRFGEVIEETWNKLGPFVKHIHMKDSKVYSDKDFDFKFMGEGKLPIPWIMKILAAAGYKGYYSFEWERGWHPEIPSCEIAFPHYVEYMRQFN